MSSATRMTLVLMLMLTIPGGLYAQDKPRRAEAPTTTAPVTAAVTPAAGEAVSPGSEADRRRSSYQIREELSAVLGQRPPELANVLALDPTLLSNEAFLAGYPELAQFVAKHPEVRHNPHFYLGRFQAPEHRRGVLEEILEGLMIFAVFSLIAFTLAWLIRTIIEQKRWNRLARTQSEVHNKILDRFGTSEELLGYMRTPAGTKFLESAPIPLHEDRVAQNPPLTRVLWSIQIGVVLAVAALGMLLVSARFAGETGQGLFAMGVIAFFVGAGFVASAAVSIFLSRRLGLWQPPLASEAMPGAEDSGTVR